MSARPVACCWPGADWLPRPAEELPTEASIAGVLEALEFARDDETAADLADIVAGMSDRSLRRLFDLGDARELSGRAAVRIYGI